MSYCGQQRRDQGCYVTLSARCEGEGKFWGLLYCILSYCVRACMYYYDGGADLCCCLERGGEGKT